MRAKVASLVAVLLIGGYVFAGPYIAVHQVKAAAIARDGEALTEHVDFVALRQSLKDQFNAMLVSDVATSKSGGGFAELGAALASVMMEKMIDALVTPAGITALVKGDIPDPAGDSDGADDSREPFNGASMSYASLNKFVVTQQNDDGDDVRIVFRRRGLTWKLCEILMPLGSASANQSYMDSPRKSGE
ncbi:MAG: DUF2939 domain-containing protein [Chromatiales bacterium]|nr:DUF2939 domain-containing protein [Chromatiales bacterium]